MEWDTTKWVGTQDTWYCTTFASGNRQAYHDLVESPELQNLFV